MCLHHTHTHTYFGEIISLVRCHDFEGIVLIGGYYYMIGVVLFQYLQEYTSAFTLQNEVIVKVAQTCHVVSLLWGLG